MNNFLFPINCNKYELVSSIQQLKNTIREDLLQLPGVKYQFKKFFCIENREYAVQAKCSQCSARMWMKEDKINNKYYLSRFQNTHFHHDQIQYKQNILPFNIKPIPKLNKLFINQVCEENYEKHHRLLYVSLCTNRKEHNLLCFSGVDNNYDIKIFGLCAMMVVTEKRVKNCIYQFFSTRKLLPSVIFVTTSKFRHIIKKYFSGTIITYPKLKITNYRIRKLLFENLLIVSSIQQWHKVKQDGLKRQKNLQYIYNMDTLSQFMDEYIKVSFICLPEMFIGVGIHIQHEKLVQDEFEEKYFSYGLDNILQFYEIFSKTIITKLEDNDLRKKVQDSLLSQNNNFCSIFSKLSNKALQHLVTQINKIYCYSIERKDQTVFFVSQSFESTFKIIVSENQLVQCQCNTYCRTGLPCSHMIIVIIRENKNIYNFIDKFWFCQ